MKKRKIVVLILALLLIVSPILEVKAYNGDLKNETFYKAKIIKIENFKLDEEKKNQELNEYMTMEVEIIKGDRKGEVVTIIEHLIENSSFFVDYKLGDRVIIFDTNKESYMEDFHIYDFYRSDWMVYLLIFFGLVVLMIGKFSGLKALVTLAISIGLVMVILPLILKGYSPFILALLAAILMTVITILIVAGFKKKSLAAILGTLIGVALAALIAYFVGNKANITGLSSEEAMMIKFIPNVSISPRSLLYSGVLLGALGAVMDVGMSIASSIEEISKANPDLSQKELYKSGMNVGKDIMGTMTNTLVLAYLGSSLPLLILFYIYNQNSPKFYNMDIIVTEVIRTIAGSIGLMVSIPITAIISARMYTNKKR